ncbi:MAG TPA: DUF6325 family protein [Ilumatobacteraceae bacterium]|nr:DUF6325 family protein [Ilumatobacteraceae bacterium]
MMEPPRHDIATDLVEYLVLVLPGLHALPVIADELMLLVASSAIRILDMVVISFDDSGTAEVMEAESIESLAPLCSSSSGGGVLLSRHDIELVSLALRAPSAAVIVVAEDRWAESLSVAARAAGGEVRAGERIARQRVELALARALESQEET